MHQVNYWMQEKNCFYLLHFATSDGCQSVKCRKNNVFDIKEETVMGHYYDVY